MFQQNLSARKLLRCWGVSVLKCGSYTGENGGSEFETQVIALMGHSGSVFLESCVSIARPTSSQCRDHIVPYLTICADNAV